MRPHRFEIIFESQVRVGNSAPKLWQKVLPKQKGKQIEKRGRRILKMSSLRFGQIPIISHLQYPQQIPHYGINLCGWRKWFLVVGFD